MSGSPPTHDPKPAPPDPSRGGPPLPLVLLPGLHGTGDLFARFVATRPEGFETIAVDYPQSGSGRYEDAWAAIEPRLPPGRFLVLGESFSGPLAIDVARRVPRVAGVVLAVTFVRPPLPRLLARLPWRLLLRRPPPLAVLSFLITGGDRDLARDVRRCFAEASPDTVAERIAGVFAVDAREALSALTVPVLDLRASRDRLVPASAGEVVAAARPGVRRVTLPGPHLLLQTAPDAAWRAITDFAGEATADERS